MGGDPCFTVIKKKVTKSWKVLEPFRFALVVSMITFRVVTAIVV